MRCLAVFAALSLLACASSPPGTEATVDAEDGGSAAGGSGGKPRGTDGRPAEASDTAASATDAGSDDRTQDAASAEDGAAAPDVGAAVGDSGSGDDAADGPPAPVVGSTCPPDKPYKLCEDFEGADAGGLPPGWTKIGKGGGTVAVATDQFHSGGKALRSESATTSQARVQRSLAGLGAGLGGTHWGRIFYRVQSPAPTAGGVMHITFAALRAGGESRVVDTVESHDGRVQFLYNLPDDSCCRGSSYNWKFDGAWHCAEWYVNAQTKAFRFFYDTTEVTQIGFTGNARSRLTDFTSIVLGVTFYQRPSRPFVAWIDDLAINDTRVGCGP